MKINVEIDTDTKAITITADGAVVDTDYFSLCKYCGCDDQDSVNVSWAKKTQGVNTGSSISFMLDDSAEASIKQSDGTVAKKVGELVKRMADVQKVSAAVTSLFNSNGSNLTQGLDPNSKKLAKELYPGAEGV